MSALAPTRADMRLERRGLFMLPTRHGLLFGLILVVLLMAAVNYNNGLAYLLVFVLAAVGVVSMLYTHRNLLHLRLTPGPCAPVFAGQVAHLGVYMHNDAARGRIAVEIEHEKIMVERVDLPPQQSVCLRLPAPTHARGYVRIPAFVVCTRYPLGLLRSWSRRVGLDHRCLVYPRPGPPRPLPLADDGPGEAWANSAGDNDFLGLRTFQPGDSPRHVHWKTVARGQGMYTKQFSGGGSQTVWLDWHALGALDAEMRLSQLCRWVLDAEQANLRYGLRLPGKTLAPNHGTQHRHRCLEALALFPGHHDAA